MRRNMIMMACIALAVASVTVSAEEQVDGTWTITARLLYWKADWETDALDGDTSGMFGPAVNVGYKRFYLGASYFTGDFDLDLKDGGTISADRSDLQLFGAYRVWGPIYPIVGYKSIQFDVNTDYADSDWSFTGPLIGVTATQSIGESGFFLFGLIGIFPSLDVELDQRLDSGGSMTYSDDASGYEFEFCGGYLLKAAPVFVRLGYRFQRIEADDDDEPADFKGFRLDLGYVF